MVTVMSSNTATIRATTGINFDEEQQPRNNEQPTQEQNDSLGQGREEDMLLHMLPLSKSWLKRTFYLCLFIFILFPLLSIFLATIFGGLLAWAESTTFFNGFLYVASNLLGMANPLTVWEPTTGTGVVVVIDMYTAVAELITFGIMLNVVNLFRVPHDINNLIRKFVTNGFLVPTIALGIIIPAYSAGLCSIMGAILALAENWHVSEGILYVLSNILGLAVPLTNVQPGNTFGKMVDVVISSIALGYIAIFADYVTTLNPSTFVRFKIRGFLIKLGVVNADQTTIAHPLRQASLINGGGEEDDDEAGVETTHAKTSLVGSFPATRSNNSIKDKATEKAVEVKDIAAISPQEAGIKESDEKVDVEMCGFFEMCGLGKSGDESTNEKLIDKKVQQEDVDKRLLEEDNVAKTDVKDSDKNDVEMVDTEKSKSSDKETEGENVAKTDVKDSDKNDIEMVDAEKSKGKSSDKEAEGEKIEQRSPQKDLSIKTNDEEGNKKADDGKNKVTMVEAGNYKHKLTEEKPKAEHPQQPEREQAAEISMRTPDATIDKSTLAQAKNSA